MNRAALHMIMSISLVIFTNLSLAMDCKIIEFADHTEAICGQGSENNSVSTSANKREKKPRANKKTTGVTQVSQNVEEIWAEEINRSNPVVYDIRISGIIVTAFSEAETTTSRGRLRVEFKCDVDSDRSDSNIIVTLSGKNRNGLEVISIKLPGVMQSGRSTVTGSAFITGQKYHDVYYWEAKNVLTKNSTLRAIAKNPGSNPEYYLSYEKATSTTEKKALDVYQDASLTTADGDFMRLHAKNGDVFFNHERHKQMGCDLCHHGNEGKIKDIGKDWAHKTCKGCHAKKGQGPTGCKQCHKK